MQLKLKSYRGFIQKILIPFFVLYVILIISMSIYFGLNAKDSKDLIPYLALIIVIAIILLCLILFVKFYSGANYIFETDKINVYSGKKFVEKIALEEIETIYYHRFKLREMVTVYFDERLGVWKLHVLLKNGTRKSLAFFSIKDVKKIKEIYGDLIQIV